MSAKPMTKKEWMTFLKKSCDEFDWNAARAGEKEFIGLTDDERTEIRESVQQHTPMSNFRYGLIVQLATELKLKEKNHG